MHLFFILTLAEQLNEEWISSRPAQHTRNYSHMMKLVGGRKREGAFLNYLIQGFDFKSSHELELRDQEVRDQNRVQRLPKFQFHFLKLLRTS